MLLKFSRGKMDKIFYDYSSFIIAYIDDMLICSDDEKDHEKHLNIFITLCKEHGIILSEKKVEIKKREIEFLGMIIDSKGIKLQSQKFRMFKLQIIDSRNYR